MTLIDDRGRVFGRINLVDGAVAALLLLLIPLAYGTYLLFRPARPHIDSVEASVVTKEEQRISAGGNLAAKFKIRGGGFTPLLRARIGNSDALGLVFENPNSADVLVGPMPPGAHDLILLDGVQEVARAAGAITIRPTTSMSIRAVGWLTNLSAESADSLKVGTSLPAGAPAYTIVALGELVPGYRAISLAGSTIALPVPGTQARRAVLTLFCDSAQGDNPCTAGDRLEQRLGPVTFGLPGPNQPFAFAVEELLPPTPPTKAVIRIRLASGAPSIRAGDRDTLLDERAATITNVTGDTVTLEAGVDRDHRGWRYRAQRVVPGAAFRFVTESYEAEGTVQSVSIEAQRP